MTLMTPVKSFKSNESVAQDLPLPPWATNMQMMSPLLFAYEEGPDPLEPSVGKKQHGVGGKAVVFFFKGVKLTWLAGKSTLCILFYPFVLYHLESHSLFFEYK